MLPLASLIRGIGAFKQRLPAPEDALPGRAEPLPLHNVHFVNGQPLRGQFPGMQTIDLGLGCFWGAERRFWQLPGVVTTAVGYQGGYTPNPTYEEVCSGLTGHTEVVLVVYEPEVVSYKQLLAMFWELHNPTQGMRQGNDIGTQYRSAIFAATPEQAATAASVLEQYAGAFREAGFGDVTTELVTEPAPFYPAEPYHQQYLFKVPNGYCPIHATGVTCG